MALSGAGQTNVGSYWALRVEWSASQSVANNTSTITARLYWMAVRSGVGYTSSSATKSGWIEINNNRSNFSGGGLASLSAGQKKQIASKTFTVTHNSDGTKSVPVEAQFAVNLSLTHGYVGTVGVSTTASLNTIPRTTNPNLSSSSVNLGSSVTINLPRASSSFTHNVTYSFGGASDTINSSAGTSTTWAPPASLANEIKTSTSGKSTITVQTKSGSTVIGTKTLSLTLTIPSNATYNPTITTPTFSESNSAIGIGKYIQNKSKIAIKATGGTKYGATIKSITFKVKASNHTGTLSGSTATTYSTPVDSGTHSVTATITDSRGRTVTSVASSFYIEPYTNPKLVSNAWRSSDNPNGIYVTAKSTWSTLGGANPLNMKVYIRTKGTASWGTVKREENSTTGTLDFGSTLYTGYSEGTSYEVLIQAKDKVSSTVEATYAIGTLKALLNAYKDEGLAIGKMYESSMWGFFQVGGGATIDGLDVTNSVSMANNSSIHGKDSTGVNRRMLVKGKDDYVHLNPDTHGRTKIHGLVDGPLTVAGDASTRPIRARGIEGSDGTDGVGNLYLNWADNQDILMGGDVRLNKGMQDTVKMTHGHGRSVSDWNRTDSSPAAWNHNPNLLLSAYNNAMSFIVGGSQNNRQAMIQVGHEQHDFAQHTGSLYLNKLGGTVYVGAGLSVTGSKNAIHPTRDGMRATPAYEMAESYLGDMGSDKTNSTSRVEIMIDTLFSDTVNTDYEYHVFLQVHSNNNVWVSERNSTNFVVESSEPNVSFSWELKAKRKGYEKDRLVLDENISLNDIQNLGVLIPDEPIEDIKEGS